jgi:hypothetical protein
VENLHGGFAVDGAEIDATLRRSNHGDPFGCWQFGHLPKTELAQDIFVGNAFATRQRGAGAIDSGSRFGRDLFLFHRAEAIERDSGSTIASSKLRTAVSFSTGSMSSSAWACWSSWVRSVSMFSLCLF